MMRARTIRARIAASIALAVLGSAVLFGGATFGAFYWHEKNEYKDLELSPEQKAVEDRENSAVLTQLAFAMALAAPIVAGGALMVGLWLSGRALAPMRLAAARARAARSGALELELPTRGLGDEWDELAGVMNDLLREQRRSIAREKEFSANAAHELRTPLTAMLGEVEVALRRERSVEEYQAALRVVAGEVKRVSSLVDILLALARAESGEVRATAVEFDLAEVARAAGERVRASSLAAGLALAVEAVATPVRGDPLLTGRVLENLLENALRHGGRRVAVAVEPRDGWGAATVADDGPGLPPAIRARLFQRFNKPPGSGHGFGLGLALAQAFTAAQGGRLRLDEPSAARSTSFVFELPLATGGAMASTQRRSA
jgi:signal transduction histidine kinase